MLRMLHSECHPGDNKGAALASMQVSKFSHDPEIKLLEIRAGYD